MHNDFKMIDKMTAECENDNRTKQNDDWKNYILQIDVQQNDIQQMIYYNDRMPSESHSAQCHNDFRMTNSRKTGQ